MMVCFFFDVLWWFGDEYCNVWVCIFDLLVFECVEVVCIGEVEFGIVLLVLIDVDFVFEFFYWDFYGFVCRWDDFIMEIVLLRWFDL